MSDTKNISFKLMNKDITDIAEGQISLEPTVDPDLGFNMFGLKDLASGVVKLLAKGKNALVNNLDVDGKMRFDSNEDIPVDMWGGVSVIQLAIDKYQISAYSGIFICTGCYLISSTQIKLVDNGWSVIATDTNGNVRTYTGQGAVGLTLTLDSNIEQERVDTYGRRSYRGATIPGLAVFQSQVCQEYYPNGRVVVTEDSTGGPGKLVHECFNIYPSTYSSSVGITAWKSIDGGHGHKRTYSKTSGFEDRHNVDISTPPSAGDVITFNTHRVKLGPLGGFYPASYTSDEADVMSPPSDGMVIYIHDADIGFSSIGLWQYRSSSWVFIG